MNAIIEPPTINTESKPSFDVGKQLQSETTAVRLRIRWPGVRKSLGKQHHQLAANTFDAESNSVSISKKLLDTSHPAFRAATAVRTQAVKYWKSSTLPYIEPGVRLLRRDDMPGFELAITSIKADLLESVSTLERHYDEMIDQARERLGDLFDPSDYEASLNDLFAIDWEYPATSPPDYLLQISPRLYQRECQRMQSRFGEAVVLAETAFAEQLSQLIGHLADRLSSNEGGAPKVFRDTAVTNLMDFFDRFERLNIRSNTQLDQLVAQARNVVGTRQPESLRSNDQLRQQVARDLTRVEASLDGWLTDRPRRRIMRGAR